MAPYSTQADVQIAAGGADELLQLTDQDDNATVDATVIARAIERADSYINSFLVKVRSVPLAVPTSEIKTRSADIAVYFLKKWAKALSQQDVDEFKMQTEWLKMLAAGDVALDQDPQPLAPTSRVDRSIAAPSATTASRTAKKGFW